MNTPTQPRADGQAAHTPTPWRYFHTQRHGPSGNLHADLFVIESDSRKSMATLEVWALNADPKWRAEHPVAVREHAETLREVEANAAFIVEACNNHARLTAENKALREAIDLAALRIDSHESETMPKWLRGLRTELRAALAAATASRSASESSTNTA